MGTLQEAAGGMAERVMSEDDAVISKGLRVARDRMSAASCALEIIYDVQRSIII